MRTRGGRGRWWPLAVMVLAVSGWAWWYYAPATLPDPVRAYLPTSAVAPAHNPVLYKWKDAQGRWNVTDTPPVGREYESVRVDPDTNVLPAGVPPEAD